MRFSAFFVYSVNSVVENDSRLAPRIKQPDEIFPSGEFCTRGLKIESQSSPRRAQSSRRSLCCSRFVKVAVTLRVTNAKRHSESDVYFVKSSPISAKRQVSCSISFFCPTSFVSSGNTNNQECQPYVPAHSFFQALNTKS